jgi:hypothetical protein
MEAVDDHCRIHVVYDPIDERPGEEIECASYSPQNNRNTGGTNYSSIVAIHGEYGHWRQSWSSVDSPSYFWLEDAIPHKFPRARVVSCEHGGVRENIIETLLWDLIDDRAANGRTHVPLIIIAHSLGGTLAKQLFIATSPSRNSWEEANILHSYIKGYMFFGTFQVGGPTEDMLRMVAYATTASRIFRSVGFPMDYSDLQPFLNQIPLINQDFESLGGLQLPTVCFYESQPTTQIGVCHANSNLFTVY